MYCLTLAYVRRDTADTLIDQVQLYVNNVELHAILRYNTLKSMTGTRLPAEYSFIYESKILVHRRHTRKKGLIF